MLMNLLIIIITKYNGLNNFNKYIYNNKFYESSTFYKIINKKGTIIHHVFNIIRT